MKEEIERWLKKSKRDLDNSGFNLKNKRYEESCFFAQQSVEKALKTVLLKKNGKIIKIHDLNILAKKVDLPENLRESCKELTMVYIQVRYPDALELDNKLEKAKKYVSFAKEILKWVEKNI